MPFLTTHILRACFEATNALLLSMLKSSDPRPHVHLTRLLSTTEILYQTSPDHFKTVQPALFRLLAARLNHGPDAAWDSVDTILATLLSRTVERSVLTANIVEHVFQLSSEIDSEEKLAVSISVIILAISDRRCSVGFIRLYGSLCNQMSIGISIQLRISLRREQDTVLRSELVCNHQGPFSLNEAHDQSSQRAYARLAKS
jgi:hypothetical protein